jgi:hypothetical protein
MPPSTHVVVTAQGLDPTAPLPDWTSGVRLLFTPRDTIALSVRFAAGTAAMPDRIATEDRVFDFVRELGSSEGLYVWSPSHAAVADPSEFLNRVGVLVIGPEQEATLKPGSHSRVDLRMHDAVPDPAVAAEIRRLSRAITDAAFGGARAR